MHMYNSQEVISLYKKKKSFEPEHILYGSFLYKLCVVAYVD